MVCIPTYGWKPQRSGSAAFLLCFLVSVLVLGFAGTGRSATIVLDPGHGGHDPGGIPRQRFVEKRLALDVALRARARLKAAGHKVIMTRSTDVFVELSQRVSIANHSHSKAVFVSIHFNAAPDSNAEGIETYHYNRRSARLAEAIHRRVVAATGGEDRGVRRARFYVLRYNRRPAVLTELGFLTNAAEGGRIARSSAYCQKLGNAVAEGIMAAVR